MSIPDLEIVVVSLSFPFDISYSCKFSFNSNSVFRLQILMFYNDSSSVTALKLVTLDKEQMS